MEQRHGPKHNGKPQCGTVMSVDTECYRAKVFLPLLNIETDYIRVGAIYAGPGWGMRCLPSVGTEVLVEFPNGDLNEGIITWRLYSEDADPAPAGGMDFELVHESGSKLRFGIDGSVTITGKTIDIN